MACLIVLTLASSVTMYRVSRLYLYFLEVENSNIIGTVYTRHIEYLMRTLQSYASFPPTCMHLIAMDVGQLIKCKLTSVAVPWYARGGGDASGVTTVRSWQ